MWWSVLSIRPRRPLGFQVEKGVEARGQQGTNLGRHHFVHWAPNETPKGLRDRLWDYTLQLGQVTIANVPVTEQVGHQDRWTLCGPWPTDCGARLEPSRRDDLAPRDRLIRTGHLDRLVPEDESILQHV